MLIEIPFKENIFKEQMCLYFELLHREKIEALHISILLFSLGLMIFIPLLFFSPLDLSNILLALVLISIYCFLIKLKLAYSRLEKKFHHKLETEVQAIKAANKPSILEFNEDYIRWEDHKMNIRLNWEVFIKIRCIQDSFLYFDLYENSSILVISKQEIGHNNYEKLTHILTHKNYI